MIVALEVEAGVDLSAFSRFLAQEGIRHRITERAGNQVLWVVNEESRQLAASRYEELRAGTLRLAEPEASVRAANALHQLDAMLHAVRRTPVTVALLLVCLLFFPLTLGYEESRFSDWLHWFTFTDFQMRGVFALFGSLGDALKAFEWWRLWTPIFIHFGLLHLAFNMVFLWVCGHRIERMHGGLVLLLLTATTGILSNLAQYWMGGPGLFGGMSGVIYGYLGYCFLWSRLRPERSFGLPSGIYLFMLIWLLLGFSGVIDLFLSGSLANGAHLGGLVAGLLLGYLAAVAFGRRV